MRDLTFEIDARRVALSADSARSLAEVLLARAGEAARIAGVVLDDAVSDIDLPGAEFGPSEIAELFASTGSRSQGPLRPDVMHLRHALTRARGVDGSWRDARVVVKPAG